MNSVNPPAFVPPAPQGTGGGSSATSNRLLFREIWLVSFAFRSRTGERPEPVCLVARELNTGITLRLWHDELRGLRKAPYPVGPEALFVAFDTVAELACHLAFGWSLPVRVVDLATEFRCLTNGLTVQYGPDLMGALGWYGLDVLDGLESLYVERLVQSDVPLSGAERGAILDDCRRRINATVQVLSIMVLELDLPRALLRGRYVQAVARMEWAGVPIDLETLDRLRTGWETIQDGLIWEVDASFGVFDGWRLNAKRWEQWLDRSGVAWPRLYTGSLDMEDDTFREMARTDSRVALIRELRVSLSQLRLGELAVGSDCRNRTALNPFQSKTGRNQPSSNKFIFGPSTWVRGLIRPEPGRAVAYVDWSQQEFGVAAALSGDPAMIDAYQSGDPYLAFAMKAGQIPVDAVTEQRRSIRELFKACTLGVQYGMGEVTLGSRINRSPVEARALLRLHRQTFPKFWTWSDGVENHALLHHELKTVFGWRINVGGEANVRSLRNFPCQANAAEILRLACCLATEQGINVVAPVHDALLVEGPVEMIDSIVARTQAAMEEASRMVLNGFSLRSEAKVVRWPDRYMDERGRGFWERVMALLPESSDQLANPSKVA